MMVDDQRAIPTCVCIQVRKHPLGTQKMAIVRDKKQGRPAIVLEYIDIVARNEALHGG